jgi:hypothetical protein
MFAEADDGRQGCTGTSPELREGVPHGSTTRILA